jgi:hypothetical protein
VSIVRVGLAETKKFADGYDAIFGKKQEKGDKAKSRSATKTGTATKKKTAKRKK